MATGYSTLPIAEARQRLRDILQGVDGVYEIITRVRDAENFHQDTATLNRSAYQSLLALVKDLEIFKKFVESNRDSLYDKEYDYYIACIDSIELQIDSLETAVVSPAITDPFPRGSENDTDVGASFEADIVTVPDGDTLVVRGKRLATDSEEKTLTVRVAGIDAAESGTERGKHAKSVTEDRWLDKHVTVFYDRHTPNDDYGRVLGTVYDGDTNFAIWSLTNCLSEPNTKFGKNHFVDPAEIKQAADKCLFGWPSYGIVKVISSPTHATVYVGLEGEDPKISEALTPCELKLPVGRYTVVITAPGYSSIRDTIEVAARKQQLPIYTLQKIDVGLGTVRISVPPIGGYNIVSVDDSVIGVAPVTVDLPVDRPALIRVVSENGEVVTEEVQPVLGKVVDVVIIP